MALSHGSGGSPGDGSNSSCSMLDKVKVEAVESNQSNVQRNDLCEVVFNLVFLTSDEKASRVVKVSGSVRVIRVKFLA